MTMAARGKSIDLFPMDGEAKSVQNVYCQTGPTLHIRFQEQNQINVKSVMIISKAEFISSLVLQIRQEKMPCILDRQVAERTDKVYSIGCKNTREPQ